MTIPTDRSHIRTEARHPGSVNFDALPTRSQVDVMVDDHAEAITAVRSAASALTAFIDDLVPRMREGGRLVYAGAGTSGRLGVLDASECPPTFQSDPQQVVGIIAGGDSALRRSSERREDDVNGIAPELDAIAFGPRDSLLGIAAGGTTPYVLGAVRLAKVRGGMAGFLTCAPEAIAEGADHRIVLDTGAEVLTGSTRLKAGTATKLALNIITTITFTRLGKVHGNLMVDLAATNDKLVDRAIRILRSFDSTLDRKEAHALLDRAGRVVKTAIVMRVRGVERGDAERLLGANGGRLRDVIG